MMITATNFISDNADLLNQMVKLLEGKEGDR